MRIHHVYAFAVRNTDHFQHFKRSCLDLILVPVRIMKMQDFIDLISELERNRKLRFAPNDFAGVKTIDNVVSILSGDAAPGSFAPKDQQK